MQTSPELCELSDLMRKVHEAPPPLTSPRDLSPVEMARKLIVAAGFFDCMKNCILEPMNKAEAAHHIETLRKLSMQIADDRVHEVYAPDEGWPCCEGRQGLAA